MKQGARAVSSGSKGDHVSVIFVLKRDAKHVKNALEEVHYMNKDFRMTPARAEAIVSDSNGDVISFQDCIAIPVLDETLPLDGQDLAADTSGESPTSSWRELILATGQQFCPFSSSVMGNPSKRHATKMTDQNQPWLPAKQALFMAAQTYASPKTDMEKIKQIIQDMSAAVCPPRVEVLGDDKNIVLPPGALLSEDLKALTHHNLQIHDPKHKDSMTDFYQQLWKQLAVIYNSPRVLRKGGVDPESRIRQTGYQLLWPTTSDDDSAQGPESLRWVTCTEQGIRQSFDVSQVMFSRGNISEKIRFGKQLVHQGDLVLDLYAGIGYYTLPAVILGQASHVYACEWNPKAIEALKYNLNDNGISKNKVTVIEGDCRDLVLPFEAARRAPINRVSLGLLPSSEGGWKTAIQALMGRLKSEQTPEITEGVHPSPCSDGGWLHIHGNVPVKERALWTNWLCRRLHRLILDEWGDDHSNNLEVDWVVVCHHVEKVKSFAPTVNHYVADVCVGPRKQALTRYHPQSRSQPEAIDKSLNSADNDVCFIFDSELGSFQECDKDVKIPSCALSADGALHQEWMMPKDSA